MASGSPAQTSAAAGKLGEGPSTGARRNVSFHLDETPKVAKDAEAKTKTEAATETATGKDAGGGKEKDAAPAGAAGGAPLRSALKPRAKDYRKLPAPEQFQHPDPLLRRLRLVDSAGQPVNLRKYFNSDVKCVGFYFSSEWAGQPLKEYHQKISDFCRAHMHGFKVIYVSVDVDEGWYKAGARGKPWVSMVWNDGSSDETEEEEADHAALYNGEDFLLGGETDIDESLSRTDTSGEAYLRPFSRVHLASKLNIIAAPTLTVYHIPSQKIIEWNVRMSRLEPGADTWEKWRNGEKAAGFVVKDLWARAPLAFFVTIAMLIYFIFVQIMGPEYNLLPKLLMQLTESIVGEQPDL